MNEIIENLLKLQALNFDPAAHPAKAGQIDGLRTKIPVQILSHYDRLVARGKKGVSIIRNQVCTACHVQVPRGVELILLRGEDIQLCENCGRYLSLPENTGPLPPAVPTAKIKKVTRKREPLLQAV